MTREKNLALVAAEFFSLGFKFLVFISVFLLFPCPFFLREALRQKIILGGEQIFLDFKAKREFKGKM